MYKMHHILIGKEVRNCAFTQWVTAGLPEQRGIGNPPTWQNWKNKEIKACSVCWMWKMLVEAQMHVGGDVVKNIIAAFQIANYRSALSTSTHVYQLFIYLIN